IVDTRHERIVATPFVKFFNHGEHPEPLPHEPFEAFEKLDGSLIIIFWNQGSWRTATKGSFLSSQASAARKMMTPWVTGKLIPGVTYLAELVGPSNRIVVPYAKDELVLLAGYLEDGHEVSRTLLHTLGISIGWRVAAWYPHESIAELAQAAKTLPGNREGWVL